MSTDMSQMRPAVLVPEAETVATALLRTAEGRSNPYPLYHRLRDLAPVHRSDAARGWLLTRYEDCKAALRDPRFQKRYEESLDARSATWRNRPALVWAGKTLLNLDGPLHTRLRRHVFRGFTRGSVDKLRPMIERLTDQLLNDLADSGEGDLMERVAFPLPIAVIGELLGVPAQDLPSFRERTMALTAVFEIGVSREQLDAADAAAVECVRYFDELIAQKRAHPDDALLSRLIQDAAGGDGLTDEEINSLATLLFFAGFETTTNMIGGGMLGLFDHPDQLELLRARPELFAHFPTELLRHSGTAQVLSRFTTEDVEVGGTLIPAGEAVFPLIGAANRDPARYPDPDRLDVTRSDIHPLAFGGGVHHCLGAALADMEIEIVFRKLVERFDVTELAGIRVPHRDRLTLRAPSEVPVRLNIRGTSQELLSTRPGVDDAAWRSAYRLRSEQDAGDLDPKLLTSRVALLKRLPLFDQCTASDLALMAATAYDMSFDPGDALCVQGADAPDCYIVVEGEAVVTINGSEVARVGADDIVGEKGPIEDQPRAATVTAATNMITFAISRDRLRHVMESNAAAAARMKEVLAARYPA